MSYRDLRDFIDRVEKLGALRRISGADPVLEIGGITEVAAGLPECPAVLFDDIKGFPSGFRVITNTIATPQRAALALGLDPALGPLDALKAWKDKRQTLQPRPPVVVNDAPFLSRVMRGDEVDIRAFPAPVWHRHDGGPYIGTGSLVVMRDPDSAWVNVGIYRVQVQESNRVTVQFDHGGRHGAIIARKYWDRGVPAPIAIVHGEDPALFIAAFEYLPAVSSEYDFAGAIKGAPIEVFILPETSLPVPAAAEIVFEGELLPDTELTLPEGPFGEFTGYYAGEARPCPVMAIRATYSRPDPILLGSPPMTPPRFHFGLPFRAATIWTNLEQAGVTDVTGVWQHVSQLMTVVALEQRYAGHAKRAALIAAAHSYMARLVVVTDEDIDPSNLNDVMWAIATRSEPSDSIDIVRQAWSSALDPRITPDDKARGATAHSKAIIDACRPFGWLDRFPRVSALSSDEVRAIEAKYGDLLRTQGPKDPRTNDLRT